MIFLIFVALLILFLAAVSLIPRYSRKSSTVLLPLVITFIVIVILHFFLDNYKRLDAILVIALLVGLSIFSLAVSNLKRR